MNEKPIGQPKVPRLLQRLQWVFDPVNYLERTARDYPDIFDATAIGFGDRAVIVSHPQALQQLLNNDRKQFSAPGESNRILEPIVGQGSTITISGERHRKRRQLVMPSFHGDRMKSYGRIIQQVTYRLMDSLAVGQTFVARDVTQAISLQVIIEAVFGFVEGDRAERFARYIRELTELFRSPLTSAFLFFPVLQKDLGAWSPWGKFLRVRQQLDELLCAEINDCRQNPDKNRTDILALLVDARDERGEALSDEELRDELMTLLFAGHETTATAMAWGLYWMNRQPETRDRLLREIQSLGDRPDVMDIVRLPYLTAFCQETLRIHPVAMLTFPRKVEEPVEMLGHHLEPGTIVLGCMYLLHQREDLYPDRDRFRPERFLERQFSPYEFMPFGGGSRRCMGEAFALFELKLVLAAIAASYSLKLASPEPEKPRRRGVTLTPARGVRLVLSGKSPNRLKIADRQPEIV